MLPSQAQYNPQRQAGLVYLPLWLSSSMESLWNKAQTIIHSSANSHTYLSVVSKEELANGLE